MEVNIARRAAVVPRAPCAAAARGAAAVGDDQREVVWVVRRGGERLRVAGAGLVDAKVAAGAGAAVGGASQILPAYVAEEWPAGVVPLHELVLWVGEVANGVFLLRHLSRFVSRLCAVCCFEHAVLVLATGTTYGCIQPSMFIVLKDEEDEGKKKIFSLELN